jgi:hypothetical protein
MDTNLHEWNAFLCFVFIRVHSWTSFLAGARCAFERSGAQRRRGRNSKIIVRSQRLVKVFHRRAARLGAPGAQRHRYL